MTVIPWIWPKSINMFCGPLVPTQRSTQYTPTVVLSEKATPNLKAENSFTSYTEGTVSVHSEGAYKSDVWVQSHFCTKTSGKHKCSLFFWLLFSFQGVPRMRTHTDAPQNLCIRINGWAPVLWRNLKCRVPRRRSRTLMTFKMFPVRRVTQPEENRLMN